MIAIERGPPPRSLDGDESAGGRERVEVSEFFAQPANRSKPFRKFKAYKADDVKQALEELFRGKCAYCETFYGPATPVDIEHYRPKGAIKGDHGSPIRPGYHWLASDWDNLLPSCSECNRNRRRDHKSGKRLSGKADWFPLLDESKRASAPGGELHEEPFLLDPCRDDPSLHLEFIRDGGVRPAEVGGIPSVRGARTIEILGLDRNRLAEYRRTRSKIIEQALIHFQAAVARLDRDPDDEDAIEDLACEMEQLAELRSKSQTYAAMARELIDPVLAACTPRASLRRQR